MVGEWEGWVVAQVRGWWQAEGSEPSNHFRQVFVSVTCYVAAGGEG